MTTRPSVPICSGARVRADRIATATAPPRTEASVPMVAAQARRSPGFVAMARLFEKAEQC